jgi:hypothetical protein
MKKVAVIVFMMMFNDGDIMGLILVNYHGTGGDHIHYMGGVGSTRTTDARLQIHVHIIKITILELIVLTLVT